MKLDQDIYEKKMKERAEYLEKVKDKQITIALTDFFFIEDGFYPDDFELVLAIEKGGTLTAGCVDKGLDYAEYLPHGIIHQSRGGIVTFDSIIAWKVIDDDQKYL